MKCDICVVTDDKLSNGLSHVEVARLSYEGGADIVQLRVKDNDPRFLDWAIKISRISRSLHKLFIVNDNVDIALLSEADGVHVGQSDMPVKHIRKLVPKDFIIGVSVGNIEEAVKAEKDGASYVALSPVFDTLSKSNIGPGKGIGMLAMIRKVIKIPLIAIGGIKRENVASVIGAGADGVAVISAVVSRKDIPAAVKDIRCIVRATKGRL
ncbi:MAG: thiamine phosphate synthase [archaeon]|nr:thiamine phosphate synthase [archaeon]